MRQDSMPLERCHREITPHINRQDISAVLRQFSFSLDVATVQLFVNGAFSGWNFPRDILSMISFNILKFSC